MEMMAPIALVQSANAELESARAFDCSARTADSLPPPVRSQGLLFWDVAPNRGRANPRTNIGGGRHGGKSKIASVSTAIGNLESLVLRALFSPWRVGAPSESSLCSLYFTIGRRMVRPSFSATSKSTSRPPCWPRSFSLEVRRLRATLSNVVVAVDSPRERFSRTYCA